MLECYTLFNNKTTLLTRTKVLCIVNLNQLRIFLLECVKKQLIINETTEINMLAYFKTYPIDRYDDLNLMVRQLIFIHQD